MYRLKKSLGQHFLKDESVIIDIIHALKQEQFTNLLEVGPGAGALTRHLIHLQSVNFKAVELDEEKVAYLEKNYPALKGKIMQQDFLGIEKPFAGSFAVIGNFPYNISTEILFKLLEWRDEVPFIIGMFQKEVAERIAANPGNKIYGVTSALIQPYYKIDYLFDVPPEKFNPPPKVMSAVIKLSRKKDVLEMKSAKAYKNLVKTAFNQRRKTLRNGVKSLFSAEVLKENIFDKRAEQLSIEDFAALSFRMHKV